MELYLKARFTETLVSMIDNWVHRYLMSYKGEMVILAPF